jgi:hypothetical protein
VIGGVVMGVLSALPVVSAGNLCCCLWVVVGGLIAAYVLQQNQTASITPADGALVGLLAGLVGACVQVVISIPIGILVAPFERAMIQRVAEMTGSMPPEVRDALDRYAGASRDFGVGFWIVRKIVELVMGLFVGAIFSTLGGLLGVALFRRNPPTGVIDIPPQA